MIFVQQIRVAWTRQSRGGRGAQRRAAVPDRFPPPTLEAPANTTTLVQLVHAAEHQGFRPEVALQPHRGFEDLNLRDVRLMLVAARLSVVRRADTRASAGFPPRGYERHLFDLAVGQWGRLRANHRHVSENHWWYEQVTTNVAFLRADQELTDAFDAAPQGDVDERVHLR
jgi:hypothetical protein